MHNNRRKLVFIFIALCSFSQLFSITYTWNDAFEDSRWQSTSWSLIGWPGNNAGDTAIFNGGPVEDGPIEIGGTFPESLVALNITDSSYPFQGAHPTFGGGTRLARRRQQPSTFPQQVPQRSMNKILPILTDPF